MKDRYKLILHHIEFICQMLDKHGLVTTEQLVRAELKKIKDEVDDLISPPEKKYEAVES